MGSTLNPDNRTITEAEVANLAQLATKRKYNRFDDARALQLRIREKLTYEEIAERLDTTTAHVQTRIKKFLSFLEDPGNLYAYQENKPDLLEAIELKLLSYLADLLNSGKCTSVKDVSLALKVVGDMTRLNKGESTANVSVLLKSIQEAHIDPLSTGQTACPEKLSSNGSSTPTELPKESSSMPISSPEPIVTLPSPDLPR
jgi:hypothetical protein